MACGRSGKPAAAVVELVSSRSFEGDRALEVSERRVANRYLAFHERVMRKAVGYIGVAGLITIAILAFMAYFVTSFDQAQTLWHDGLGRTLSDSPWFMRMFFGQERQWAGFGWFALDMLVFWGGGILAFKLIGWGLMDSKEASEGEAEAVILEENAR